MTALVPSRVRPLLFVLAFMALGFCAKAAPGDLDPTFAENGKTRLGFYGGPSGAEAIVGQADGKMVTAGFSRQGTRNGITLLRHNPDGSLDISFDHDGIMTFFVDAYDAFATGVALQSDGKIVVCGYSSSGGFALGFVVARVNPDGSLDATFGAGGIVFNDLPGNFDSATAVAVQGDGRIVVAGTSAAGFTALRYHSDGQLDNSFDGDGVATMYVGPNGGGASALLIQPDGKLVLAGVAGSDFAVVRFHPHGTPDSSFGGTGVVTTGIGSSSDVATSIALQFGNDSVSSPDKLVVAGYTYNSPENRYDFAVARYFLDGSLDTSFDGDGKLTTVIAGDDSQAYAVTVTGFGTRPRKIIVAGTIGGSFSGNGFAMVRYNANGSLDTTLDGDGMLTTPLGNDTQARAMGFFGTVVAGWSSNNFTIVRYNGDGSLDTSFDGDGKRIDQVGLAPFAIPHAVAIQPDGRIVVAGEVERRVPATFSSFAVLRLTSAGQLDPSFGTGGKINMPPGTARESGRSLMIQPDGKVIVAGSGGTPGAGFLFRRYRTDGTFDMQGGTSIGANGSQGMSAALLPNGKVIMAGQALVTAADWDFALVRFNSDGLPDNTFGGSGYITIPMGTTGDFVFAMAIQPDGKIVAGGNGLVRCHPDGTLDSSFEFDGRVFTPGPVNALSLHQGKILVACRTQNAPLLVRYNSDGSPDSSFGGDGIVTNTLADTISGIAVQSDGRILAAGQTRGLNTDVDFVVVRFNADGSVDGSYGVGGKATVPISNGSDTDPAIALDSFGRAVLAGNSETVFGIARLLGDFVPRLAIARSGGGLEVSWPEGALGYLLQLNTNLSAGGWSDVANSRTTNRMVMPNPVSTMFYRLKL